MPMYQLSFTFSSIHVYYKSKQEVIGIEDLVDFRN